MVSFKDPRGCGQGWDRSREGKSLEERRRRTRSVEYRSKAQDRASERRTWILQPRTAGTTRVDRQHRGQTELIISLQRTSFPSPPNRNCHEELSALSRLPRWPFTRHRLSRRRLAGLGRQ